MLCWKNTQHFLNAWNCHFPVSDAHVPKRQKRSFCHAVKRTTEQVCESRRGNTLNGSSRTLKLPVNIMLQQLNDSHVMWKHRCTRFLEKPNTNTELAGLHQNRTRTVIWKDSHQQLVVKVNWNRSEYRTYYYRVSKARQEAGTELLMLLETMTNTELHSGIISREDH